MEYSVNKLSKMSGVSARTLRYYDEIGLLHPIRVASSGYRIYAQAQVDILQQILLYRELDFSLGEITALLSDPGFDKVKAFQQHLSELCNKRDRLHKLIGNVTQSIAAMKGEFTMTDKEKFEGLKQTLLDENERKYGAEIRVKYGDAAVDESNARLKGLTQEQYDESVRLSNEVAKTLKAAFESGNPAGDLAQTACDLHRQWLCIFYPQYSTQYHMGLGEMYVADERFRAYYDKISPGCAEFLRDAINIYCAKP